MFGARLEVEMSKKCTQLWREARFEVKMYTAHQVRRIFGLLGAVSCGKGTGFYALSQNDAKVRVSVQFQLHATSLTHHCTHSATTTTIPLCYTPPLQPQLQLQIHCVTMYKLHSATQPHLLHHTTRQFATTTTPLHCATLTPLHCTTLQAQLQLHVHSIELDYLQRTTVNYITLHSLYYTTTLH